MPAMVPRVSTATAHASAIRLCGLMYFFAFLGNVIDGPVMWMLTAPGGGFTASGLCWLNALALVPSLVVVARPRCWIALAACWPLWYVTYTNGNGPHGTWFFDSWDTMLLDAGFLCVALAISLTLHDGEVEAARRFDDEGCLAAGLLERAGGQDDGADEPAKVSRGCLCSSRSAPPAAGDRVVPCGATVRWSLLLSELSLTLLACRIFAGSGLLKLAVGSSCWRDLTCLYDFFEMQMCPTRLAWFLHNYVPHTVMQLMQFFAINVAECIAPFLCLGYGIGHLVISLLPEATTPKGCRTVQRCLEQLAALRWFNAVIIIVFVSGMYVGGNFAFLHPLSLVPVVASLGTVHSIPVTFEKGSSGGVGKTLRKYYTKLAPGAVMCLLLFAFLPSLQAYAWMLRGTEDTGSLIGSFMSLPPVRVASELYLGIPYQRHDYFATGLVHVRNEMVLSARLGDEWVELDIPLKVGSLDRIASQSSPLHRRFAWMWWFLPMTGEGVVGEAASPVWFNRFLDSLCRRDRTAWAAVENGPSHDRLPELRRVAAQMYSYHFSKPGASGWWTRVSHGNVSWPGLGSTRIEKVCG